MDNYIRLNVNISWNEGDIMVRVIQILCVIVLFILTACTTSTTSTDAKSFGEGDSMFSIEVVDSNFQISEIENAVVHIGGTIDLKLSNKGEKQLPFTFNRDTAGILIEFDDADTMGINQDAMLDFRRISLVSNEGPVTLIPGTSPTYTYSFDSNIPTTSFGSVVLVPLEGYSRAKYYFYFGEELWLLNGQNSIAQE